MAGQVITVGLWYQDPQLYQSLSSMAERSDRLQVAFAITSFESLDQHLAEHPVDVLVVDYDTSVEGLEFHLERFHLHHPELSLLFLADRSDPDVMLRAMRLGAREFLVKPLDEREFARSLVRLARRVEATRRRVRRAGRLVAVVGAKGGLGVTTLSLNLAAELAAAGAGRVALFDLNLINPDAAVALDLEPVRHLGDLARNSDRLDDAMLEEALLDGEGLFKVLCGPPDFVEAAEVRPEDVDKLLLVAADSFDWLILDLAPGANDVTVKALDRAQTVLLYCRPTVIGLKNAKRVMSLFAKLGYGPEKVKIILGRTGNRGDLGASQVKSVFGQEPYFSLPEDVDAVQAAEAAARPLLAVKKRANLRKGVYKLAARLTRDLPDVNAPPGEISPRKEARTELRVVKG